MLVVYGVCCVWRPSAFCVPLQTLFYRQYILTVNFSVNALKRSNFVFTTIFSC